MPTNQTTISALESRTVPPDLACIIPQALADAIPQVVRVVGLASQVQGAAGVTPITNNTGQQALTLAQSNLVKIQALQDQVVERRLVAYRQNVNPGDSVQPFAMSPGMPSEQYMIHVMLEGPATHPAAYYGWRLVSGTQTATSFSLSFDNIGASTLVTVLVESTLTVQAP